MRYASEIQVSQDWPLTKYFRVRSVDLWAQQTDRLVFAMFAVNTAVHQHTSADVYDYMYMQC